MAVNKRFGGVNTVPSKLQLLTDNGLAYISRQTKSLLKALGVEDCKTAVSKPQSNEMAESFVKTLKCYHSPFIDLTSATTALACLPEVVARYNRDHPHSALGYQSPREFCQNNGIISNENSHEQGPIYLILSFMSKSLECDKHHIVKVFDRLSNLLCLLAVNRSLLHSTHSQYLLLYIDMIRTLVKLALIIFIGFAFLNLDNFYAIDRFNTIGLNMQG